MGQTAPDCLQQTFLSTDPVIATEGPLTVAPMAGFFAEQFAVNDRPAALRYWQVWDRTADKPLPAGAWTWDAASGTVTLAQFCPSTPHGQFFGMAALGRNQYVQPRDQ